MNILAVIRNEERRLQTQIGTLRRQLDGLRTAQRALGNSAANGAGGRKARGRRGKRGLSAEARARISAAAKRRWAKFRAQSKKSAS